MTEDTPQTNANVPKNPQQPNAVKLLPYCSDDDLELEKNDTFIDDMGLVLLSSEPSNCLRPIFQNF